MLFIKCLSKSPRKTRILFLLFFATICFSIFTFSSLLLDLRNEKNENIISLDYKFSGDSVFYNSFFEKYHSYGGLVNIIDRHYDLLVEDLVRDDDRIDAIRYQAYWLPGPIVPMVYTVFDYNIGNSSFGIIILYLSLLLLIFLLWEKIYFKYFGHSRIDIIVLCITPSFYYYIFSISSEMIFLFIFSIYFYLLRYYENTKIYLKEVMILVIFAALLALIRPNGMLSFIVIILYLTCACSPSKISGLVGIGLSFVCLICFFLFYYPYMMVSASHSTYFTYFGLRSEDFLTYFDSGIDLLNLLFGWVALFFAKVLYYTGVRPSYSDVDSIAVLVRSAFGVVILLPGLFLSLVQGSNAVRIVVIIFSVPVIAGVSQDRYIFHLIPVFVLFVSLGVQELGRAFNRRRLSL